jgi:hypothetical protein
MRHLLESKACRAFSFISTPLPSNVALNTFCDKSRRSGAEEGSSICRQYDGRDIKVLGEDGRELCRD